MKSISNNVNIIWQDTKRIFGMPISFTKYAIIEAKSGEWIKIVEESGVLSTNVEEVMAYRVDDVGVFQSATAKLFGVGNVEIYCKDASTDVLVLKNIKNPYKVKDIITDIVERERRKRGIRYSEVQY